MSGAYADLIPGASPSRRSTAYDDLLPGGAPAVAVQPAEDAVVDGGSAAASPGTALSAAARGVLTRGGRTILVDQSAPKDNWDADLMERRAPVFEGGPGVAVVPSIIPGAAAQTRSSVANLRRMANEESIQQRQMVLDSTPIGGPVLPHMVQRALERQRAKLAEEIAARPAIEDDAATAMQDLAAATPKDMSTFQKGVFAAGTSAPTTLAGMAVGTATRSPTLAMLIAGGGGSTMQAGSTYGEAREKLASKGVADEEAHRTASIAATIDGAIEGLDALPIGMAMKPGSSFLKRLAKVTVTEPLTEGGQQALQDFRAMAMEDPEKTLGEVWENAKVAMVAGAVGGPVHATIGEAANLGQKKAAPMHGEAEPASAAAPVEPPVVQPAAAPVAKPTATTAYDDLVPAAANDQGVEKVAAMPAEEGPKPVQVPETVIDKATDVQQMRAAARTYAKENLHGTNVTNEVTGFDIGIRRRGVAHALTDASPDEIALIPVIPQLLETAHYAGKEEDLKGRPSIKAYHLFDAVAERGGERMKVRLVVRENQYGKFFYDHTVTEKTTPDGTSRAEGPKPQVRIEPTSGAEESLRGDDDTGNLGMPATATTVPAAAAAGATPPASARSKIGKEQARPDAIRAAMRHLFGAPISEKGLSKKYLGIYKIKPQAIRLQNRNDLRTAAHEVGHHISNLNRPFRKIMRQHQGELVGIAPRAYIQQALAKYGSMQAALAQGDVRRLLIEEGFAEFIAEYLTNPATLQAKVPSFYQAFETWLGQNPKSAAALSQVADMVGAHQALGAADKILAKVGAFKPPFRERAKALVSKETYDTFVQATLDKWHPAKTMVEDLAPGLAASKNPYVALRLLANDAAVIEDWINNFASPYDYQKRIDVKKYGKPLSAILEPVLAKGEATINDFKAYLIARRAAELMKVGKENLLTKDEIAQGLALETPELKAVAQEVYAYNDRLLDFAVEGGLLSPQVAAEFKKYANYIPFFREPEGEAAKGDGRGNPFKRLTGGTQNLRDPIANLIQNTANIIHATNRNAAIQKAVALATEVPGGGRWIEQVKVPQEAQTIATDRIIEELQKQGVVVDRSMAQNMAAMQTFFTPSGKGDDRTRTIVYKDGGELKAAQINDPLLWKALGNLPPLEMNLLFKILALPASTLRAGVVLDPTFMARNPIRDTLAAMVQSKGKFIPGLSTAQGIKLMAQNADAYKLWRAFGGAFADQFREPEEAGRIIERMAKRGNFSPASIITPTRWLDALKRVGSLTESGSRIAEFAATYKPGDIDSALQAALNSREVSTDFGMRGGSDAIQLLTRITPFMNPAMQGLYKTARVLSTADGKAAAGKAAMVGGAMALLSVALALKNSDEDWYRRIEEWEKATYWHFKLGDNVYRVAKPFEYGALFASIPEAIALRAKDMLGMEGGEGGEDFKKRILQTLGQVFGFRVIPQAATIVAEPWANKSLFTGRKIVPDKQQHLEPGLQANPSTTKVAQLAGEAANVSPAVIDNVVRNVFGTIGVHVSTVGDLILEASGAVPKGHERTWQSWPVLKAFVRDPDNPNTKQTRDFYDSLEKYRTAVQTVKELRERGEEAKADAYKESHADELASAKSAEAASKRLAKLRKAINAIEWSRDLSPADKREAINEKNVDMRDIVEEQTPLYQAAKNSYSRAAKEEGR